MSAFQCELCGSNRLIKKDGAFQCEDCGTKYTLEEVRKLFAKASAIHAKPDVSSGSPSVSAPRGKITADNHVSSSGAGIFDRIMADRDNEKKKLEREKAAQKAAKERSDQTKLSFIKAYMTPIVQKCLYELPQVVISRKPSWSLSLTLTEGVFHKSVRYDSIIPIAFMYCSKYVNINPPRGAELESGQRVSLCITQTGNYYIGYSFYYPDSISSQSFPEKKKISPNDACNVFIEGYSHDLLNRWNLKKGAWIQAEDRYLEEELTESDIKNLCDQIPEMIITRLFG